jgi:hypothetical protein
MAADRQLGHHHRGQVFKFSKLSCCPAAGSRVEYIYWTKVYHQLQYIEQVIIIKSSSSITQVIIIII